MRARSFWMWALALLEHSIQGTSMPNFDEAMEVAQSLASSTRSISTSVNAEGHDATITAANATRISPTRQAMDKLDYTLDVVRWPSISFQYTSVKQNSYGRQDVVNVKARLVFFRMVEYLPKAKSGAFGYGDQVTARMNLNRKAVSWQRLQLEKQQLQPVPPVNGPDAEVVTLRAATSNSTLTIAAQACSKAVRITSKRRGTVAAVVTPDRLRVSLALHYFPFQHNTSHLALQAFLMSDRPRNHMLNAGVLMEAESNSNVGAVVAFNQSADATEEGDTRQVTVHEKMTEAAQQYVGPLAPGETADELFLSLGPNARRTFQRGNQVRWHFMLGYTNLSAPMPPRIDQIKYAVRSRTTPWAVVGLLVLLLPLATFAGFHRWRRYRPATHSEKLPILQRPGSQPSSDPQSDPAGSTHLKASSTQNSSMREGYSGCSSSNGDDGGASAHSWAASTSRQPAASLESGGGSSNPEAANQTVAIEMREVQAELACNLLSSEGDPPKSQTLQ